MATQWSREHGGTDWLLGDPRVTRYLCNSMSLTNYITEYCNFKSFGKQSMYQVVQDPKKYIVLSSLVTYTRHLLRFLLPEENSFTPA